MTMESLCASKSESSDRSIDQIIFFVWQLIAYFIYNILAIIIMITTMVFAGEAIRKNVTGEAILLQYDFGVYIYCLVNYGLLACAQVMNYCAGCTKI
jgi:hypothetical protein